MKRKYRMFVYVYLYTFWKCTSVFNMQGFLGHKNETQVITFLNAFRVLRWSNIIS